MGSVLANSRDVALWLIDEEMTSRAATCVSNAWIAARLTPSIDFAIFHAEPGAGPPWISLRRMRRRVFRPLRSVVAPDDCAAETKPPNVRPRELFRAISGGDSKTHLPRFDLIWLGW
jgi:hypothetical protein